ncbi:bis(5'-nucleosyl)-tetraphosphatase (symmetrical) YqeK [Terrilactibacillus laevilacticus]|uniref:bis(5'-nucleosyl)-tetraphosphatase (symmetrical) n=1 Tax=Terrilactibacillus laevilacticus TaxID=1380157 RepID=A0ABW5PTZ1_9BACI|nr:bis(5'-nucleosyl)-tetraphosphatase (symmetrical) YqeK [Terrilactibacillus laevilacticus]
MRIEEANEAVQAILPKKRYIHTLGVVETAEKLAERYDANIEQAKLAAMLHDIAKYFSKEELSDIIKRRHDITNEILTFHHSLWHAPVGAAYIEEKYHITDKEVLDAVRYHTTGRQDMSLLDKIVFLADYIEPGREFPGVDEVRHLAKKNLDAAVGKSLQNTVIFLVERHQQVYPDTIYAYNTYIKNLRSCLNEQ